MSRAPGVLVVWGVFLSGLAGMLWAWSSDPLPPALLTAAAAASYLGAAGIVLYCRRARARALRIPGASPSSALLGLGVSVALLGFGLGRWLVWLGGGIVLVSLIGLAVELAGGRAGDAEPAPWSEPPRGRPPTT